MNATNGILTTTTENRAATRQAPNGSQTNLGKPVERSHALILREVPQLGVQELRQARRYWHVFLHREWFGHGRPGCEHGNGGTHIARVRGAGATATAAVGRVIERDGIRQRALHEGFRVRQRSREESREVGGELRDVLGESEDRFSMPRGSKTDGERSRSLAGNRCSAVKLHLSSACNTPPLVSGYICRQSLHATAIITVAVFNSRGEKGVRHLRHMRLVAFLHF